MCFRDIIKKLREDFKILTWNGDADPELRETGDGAGIKSRFTPPKLPRSRYTKDMAIE